MNKRFWFFIILLLCTSTITPGYAQKKVKIGFAMANLFADRWLKDKESLPKAAEELGAYAEVYNAENDHEKQFSQVKAAIKSGIDILILIPVDAVKAGEIVKYAHRKKVKVISYDRLVLNAQPDCYVSFDPIKTGKVEAAYALSLKPKGNYMILKGPQKDYNAVLFAKGQMEVLEPHIKSGDIKIIYEKHLTEWGDMEAFMDLQEFIPFHSDEIDVILSTSDKSAQGTILLIESLGLDPSQYIITGQNASIMGLKLILADKMVMSVYKPVKKLAVLAVQVALNLHDKRQTAMKASIIINNGKFNIPAYYVDPIAIDKENMNVVIDDGYWTQEALTKDN